VSETITLSTLGPHSPDYTREIAWGLAECMRVLNYATGSGADAGIAYPATAYDVLGALYTATGRLPQLLSQLSGWLEQAAEAGRLAEDRHGDVIAAVATAQEALAHAGGQISAVTSALQAAQNAIAGLYMPGDGEGGGPE
jgi:hypothetical protein